MIILPAIDLKDGKCVRLYKGDFNTAEQVAADPLATALRFQEDGARWLHMVDLDGACQGRPINKNVILQIVKNTKLNVEVGGGIRDRNTIVEYLSQGVARVILGTAAIENPELLIWAISTYGSRIAVGIDAKDEKVMVSGWLQDCGSHYLDVARRLADLGVEYFIFTDISKDGTLNGPNFKQLEAIQRATGRNIIASGGVRDINHIKQLKAMAFYGAICGKSIYKGTLNLKEALQAAADDSERRVTNG